MSIAGILSSALFSSGSSAAQSAQSKVKSFRQEFEQLGQDLQSGNTSAAQADVAGLQQLVPLSSSQSSSPIAQAFHRLSQDLKAGNTTAAQSDFATIQQDFQTQVSQTPGHHHHHHSGSGGGGTNVSQLLDQLGQELQSGDLTGAQTAYGSLQQNFPDLQSGANGVSFSA